MKYGIPENSTINLPIQEIDKQAEKEEKAIANLVSRPEWEQLRQHFEDRILFYQQYLPDGNPVASVSPQELAARWASATIVIQELKAVIDTYEEIAKNVEQRD